MLAKLVVTRRASRRVRNSTQRSRQALPDTRSWRRAEWLLLLAVQKGAFLDREMSDQYSSREFSERFLVAAGQGGAQGGCPSFEKKRRKSRSRSSKNWRRPAFEPEAAKPRKRSRISVKRNASQLARAPGAMHDKSFIRVRIKLAGAGVALNGGVKLLRVECLEPGAKRPICSVTWLR